MSCPVSITFIHHHHHISLLLSTNEHRPPQLISSVTGPMPPESKFLYYFIRFMTFRKKSTAPLKSKIHQYIKMFIGKSSFCAKIKINVSIDLIILSNLSDFSHVVTPKNCTLLAPIKIINQTESFTFPNKIETRQSKYRC